MGLADTVCVTVVVLVALLANTHAADRAVLTGMRNFVRILGGSVGIAGNYTFYGLALAMVYLTFWIAVSGAILNSILRNRLSGRFDAGMIQKFTSSSFALADLHLDEQDQRLVLEVYMQGIHAVFVSFAILILALVVCFFLVKDRKLGDKAEFVPSDECIAARDHGEDANSHQGDHPERHLLSEMA